MPTITTAWSEKKSSGIGSFWRTTASCSFMIREFRQLNLIQSTRAVYDERSPNVAKRLRAFVFWRMNGLFGSILVALRPYGKGQCRCQYLLVKRILNLV